MFPSKTASAVADTIISMLKPYQAHVHTITTEPMVASLSEHERVAAELEARNYFAHPAQCMERGQNENSNGLRQYVPKGSDLSVETAEALSAVEKWLNFRLPPGNAWDLSTQVVLTNF